jgi:polysaccharide pyruvyl transferase WcaK-like protein
VRILVEQSGYDLLNSGDIAMLQACVLRMRRLWPDADIDIVCHSPERLSVFCPGARSVGPTLSGRLPIRLLPRRPRLAVEQAFKMLAPLVAGRLRRRLPSGREPRTLLQSILAADIVVASGGGYLCDPWWWHGHGVLTVLGMAQRLGKPTAMFGQGVGPLHKRLLRRRARRVIPKLTTLGLREGACGPTLLRELGVPESLMVVTGDDALEFMDSADRGREFEEAAIGLNLRVADYTAVDAAAAREAADVVDMFAAAHSVPLIPLPVSYYPYSADLADIERATAGSMARVKDSVPRLDVMSLARTEESCRVVVTTSYHAAVLAVGQGVPAVCLTRSSYYDGKFEGLASLFPLGVAVVRLGERDTSERLEAALAAAWELPESARSACRRAAIEQRNSGRRLYEAFRRESERLIPLLHAPDRLPDAI